MLYYVRNDTVQNGLGYAIPNIAVTYYTQPSLALASVFSSASGGATTNPQFTNGLGQTVAYLAAGTYTIQYSGAQIQTQTLADQIVGGSGSGVTITTFEGVLQGTVDGVNRVFTLTNGGTALTTAPTQVTVWDNYAMTPGVGYTLSGVIVTFTIAPSVGDIPTAQGFTLA